MLQKYSTDFTIYGWDDCHKTDHVCRNWSDERSDLVVRSCLSNQVLAVAIQNDILQALEIGLPDHVAESSGRDD